MSSHSFASVHTNPHPPSFSRILPNDRLGSDHTQDLFFLPAVGPSIETFGSDYSVPAPSRFGDYNIYHNRCYPGCEKCVCQEYSEPKGQCLKWKCISSGVSHLSGDGDGSRAPRVEGFGGPSDPRRKPRGPSMGVLIIGGAVIAVVLLLVCQSSSSRKK